MKIKEMPLRYSCLAYYYIGKEKLAYRFKNVKTKAGIYSFENRCRKKFNLDYKLKIEYTDKQTGITKQF